MTVTRLETPRLVLRRPAEQDWPAFHRFFLSDRCDHVGGQGPLTRIWRSFAFMLGHWDLRGFGLFALAPKETPEAPALGFVGPYYPGGWPEREIGWMIFDPAVEGTGLAREAALAARTHAYDTLGWETAVSYIAPANARSRALAERLGARIDPDAAHPGDDPTLVYRHPAPSEAER